MANTTNLNLEKPLDTDQALISVINSNSDKIDAYAGSTNQALSNMHNSGALSNVDCNAYTQNMTYRIGNVATLTNAPSGIGSTGVFKIDVYGAFILQHMDLNLGSAFRFSFDSGSTWTNWNVLATKSDVEAIGADFSIVAGSNKVTINSQRCELLRAVTNVKFVWVMFTLSEAESGGVLFTGFQSVAVSNSIVPIYKVSATETAIYSMRIGTNGNANANGSIPAGQYVAMGIYP